MWQGDLGVDQTTRRGLVLDNITLDKPYARNMELGPLERQPPPPGGAGHQPARVAFTGGNALVSCDFRIYCRPLSELTKNDHFRRMLELARAGISAPLRPFRQCWYASAWKI